MTEFPDQNHPGRVIARGNKEEMRARLATIVAKFGAAEPLATFSDPTIFKPDAWSPALGLLRGLSRMSIIGILCVAAITPAVLLILHVIRRL